MVLRIMYGYTKRDLIRNEENGNKVGMSLFLWCERLDVVLGHAKGEVG